MKYSSSNPPIKCIMTQSTCYQGTRQMAIKGVLWHSTGANNPNLKRYVQPDDDADSYNILMNLIGRNGNENDWNHKHVEAGLNAWIGKLANGSVAAVQTMPWNYRPWGCGSGKNGSCNNGWIQFEICEDNLKDATYFNAVYKEACELTAYLCKQFSIDPLGTVKVSGINVPTILCHYDSYKLGLGSGHVDVMHWFSKHNKTMDDVRKDVAALMGIQNGSSGTAKNVVCTPELQVLKKGMVGRDVRNAMLILSDLGYYADFIPSYDETFGPKMDIAVRLFQKDRKLVDDGVIGPKTYEELYKG